MRLSFVQVDTVFVVLCPYYLKSSTLSLTSECRDSIMSTYFTHSEGGRSGSYSLHERVYNADETILFRSMRYILSDEYLAVFDLLCLIYFK